MKPRTTLLLALFALALQACQNSSPTPPAAAPNGEAILKHKYWVSKEFSDALLKEIVADTLNSIPCSELIFTKKDTLLLTACMSDAGRATFKATGPNTLDIALEGMENEPVKAIFEARTGVLTLHFPGDSTGAGRLQLVARDEITLGKDDFDGTVKLARLRLSGTYKALEAKAKAPQITLNQDGSHIGLSKDFDRYEPWPAGVGGYIEARKNLMYLENKGKEPGWNALAWQLRGDTLRLWETKNIGKPDEMPEYQITSLLGTYLKQR